jgi:PIN domain nuclease of toxin-antitoxin system
MTARYVSDTNALIWFFGHVFEQPSKLSTRATRIFEHSLSNDENETKLIIPSVVFIEIYEKWLMDEEFSRKFYYEVFCRIKESPNIEIKPIEREVIEVLQSIGGVLLDHDIHDKIILASAMMLYCPLITHDRDITEYVNNNNNVIPSLIT